MGSIYSLHGVLAYLRVTFVHRTQDFQLFSFQLKHYALKHVSCYMLLYWVSGWV